MNILNIIESWTEKNPNPNFESYSTRESLSLFIQNRLEDKHTWSLDIESSNEIKNDDCVNKKLLNCECENKLTYLNSIKSIIQVKLNERDHLFKNLIKKLNITDKNEMDYIFDYVVNDFGTEKSIGKILENNIDI